MLSYDGQKIFNSNSRYGRGKRRGLFNQNKRDQSQGKNTNSGNGSKNFQGGKSKKKKSDQVFRN